MIVLIDYVTLLKYSLIVQKMSFDIISISIYINFCLWVSAFIFFTVVLPFFLGVHPH